MRSLRSRARLRDRSVVTLAHAPGGVRLLALAAGLGGLCLAPHPADAATWTWDGGAGNVNWNDKDNWGGANAPTSNTSTDLIFTGTTNTGTAATPLNQNIANPMLINSITFDAAAGSFYLGGNRLYTDNDISITQNSGNAQQIANSFTVNANGTQTLTLDGNGSGLVTLTGDIKHSNGQRDIAVVKDGSSTFLLTGSGSDYTKGTTINAGTLIAGHANALGSGSISVMSGGTFAIASGVTFTHTASLSSGATLAGSGTYNPSAALTVASGVTLAPGIGNVGTLTIGKNTTFSSGSTLAIDLGSGAGNADLLAISGVLTVNSGANLTFNTLSAPDQGKYTLLTYTSKSGAGTFTTTLPTGYRLSYGSTSLDLVQQAVLSGSVTPVHSTVITGGTVGLNVTVKNDALTGGDTLNNYSVAAGVHVTGSGVTGGPLAAQATASPSTGLAFNSAGLALGGNSGSVTLSSTDAGVSGTTLNFNVNVIDHAAPSATVTAGDAFNVLANTPLSATIHVANAAGDRADLQVAGAPTAGVGSLSNPGPQMIAAGGGVDYTVDFTPAAAGAFSNTITFSAGDDQSMAGHGSLSNLTATITGNVYNPAVLSVDPSGQASNANAGGTYDADAKITALSITGNPTGGGWTVNLPADAIQGGAGPLSLVTWNDGTLLNGVYNATLNLAADHVIHGSGDVLGSFTQEIALQHTVTGHAGVGATFGVTVAAGESLAGLNLGSGDSDGGNGAALDTVATILQGTAASDTTVQMSFDRRADAAPEVQALLQSDILHLTGITGMFVLQMTYDPTINPDSPAWIAYLDPESGLWINAVLGNSDGGASSQFFIEHAYDADTDFHLGYFGYDSSTHTAWAVLDHNSSFAVVPEPANYFALATAGFAAAGYRRKRDRQPRRLA